MTKAIYLKSGETVLVDDEDYPIISRYSWRKSNKNGYAMTTFKFTDEAEHTVYLHKLVMGMGCFGVCDHVNGDVLDCRKDNLRRATHQENGWNKAKQKSVRGLQPTSQYKGVSRVESKTKGTRWVALIRHSGRTFRLGYFSTEEAAARAWNKKAKEYRGEFAWLNPVPDAAA